MQKRPVLGCFWAILAVFRAKYAVFKQIPAVFKQIRHFSSTCDAFCATNGLSQRSCGVLLEKCRPKHIKWGILFCLFCFGVKIINNNSSFAATHRCEFLLDKDFIDWGHQIMSIKQN